MDTTGNKLLDVLQAQLRERHAIECEITERRELYITQGMPKESEELLPGEYLVDKDPLKWQALVQSFYQSAEACRLMADRASLDKAITDTLLRLEPEDYPTLQSVLPERPESPEDLWSMQVVRQVLPQQHSEVSGFPSRPADPSKPYLPGLADFQQAL